MTESLFEKRILIIDDDQELCELLTSYLQQESLSCHAVHEGDEGLKLARTDAYSLVVLDIMLPGISGFDILQVIRNTSQVPVIMLTARGDDIDRIIGLEMGADDYIAKPFNPRELIARIRAIARRFRWVTNKGEVKESNKLISFGDLILDVGTRTVKQKGDIIPLTSVEFSMLQELLNNIGKVVDRDHLAAKVLGRALEEYDRSVDVHVSNLRKKLGHKINGVERIKNVRGVGYQYSLT